MATLGHLCAIVSEKASNQSKSRLSSEVQRSKLVQEMSICFKPSNYSWSAKGVLQEPPLAMPLASAFANLRKAELPSLIYLPIACLKDMVCDGSFDSGLVAIYHYKGAGCIYSYLSLLHANSLWYALRNVSDSVTHQYTAKELDFLHIYYHEWSQETSSCEVSY